MTELAFDRDLAGATRAGHPALGLIPRDALGAGLILLALAFFDGVRDLHGLSGRVYWEDWSDQLKYLTSARAFVRGDFDASRHWYPLLYPLGLAAFSWLPGFSWLPAFLGAAILDALCYGLAYLGFRQVATRFGISSPMAFAMFLATTMVEPTLAKAWIVPWTTTLSAALIWLGLGRVCIACDVSGRPPRPAQLFATGVLLGLIPLCRPADVVISVILGAFLVARVWRSPGRSSSAAALIGGCGLVVGAYGALHLAIYGARASDYMKLSAAFGVDFTHLGWKALTLVVYPGAFFPYGAGLLERYPWLLLGAAGFLVSALRPQSRRLALLLGLPALAYAALMIAYADLTPSDIWTLRLYHYFKWLMPAFALFGYEFVRSFPRRKAVSIVALAAVASASCLQYDAVAAGPAAPAQLLLFAAPDPDVHKVYMALSIVQDRGGLLRNLLDYHQVPDGSGLVYAEASRRDFAGGEIWRDAPAALPWPVFQPTPLESPPMLGEAGRAPIARYRAELAFGAPCWLSRRACERPLPPADAPPKLAR